MVDLRSDNDRIIIMIFFQNDFCGSCKNEKKKKSSFVREACGFNHADHITILARTQNDSSLKTTAKLGYYYGPSGSSSKAYIHTYIIGHHNPFSQDFSCEKKLSTKNVHLQLK